MSRQVTILPVTEKTVATGNWDTSRVAIDRIIIHTMVGSAQSADARFNNPTQQVSAHYGVLLNGSIWHWVDEDNTAYHAGDYSVNQRSIGIEHEDNGDYNGTRPDALYSASAKLVRDICQFYGIPIDRSHILKHSEVHATGCPDALDIDRIVREAQGSTPTPDNNGKKAVQFDKITSFLHSISVIPTDHSEDYVDNDKLVKSVQDLSSENKRKEDFIGKIKVVVYAKWTSSSSGANSWITRLHQLKALYEK